LDIHLIDKIKELKSKGKQWIKAQTQQQKFDFTKNLKDN
jgi:hypothetical protein